jgi:hypothetical protein
MFDLFTLFAVVLGIPVILAFFIGRWVLHTGWMILLWLSVSWWWLIFLFGAGNAPTNVRDFFSWVLGCLVSAVITAVPLTIGRLSR